MDYGMQKHAPIDARQTIADIGERGLISLIRARASQRPADAGLVVGIGDDCAVARPAEGCDIVLKSDCVIAGRHFDDSAPPRLVGRKALGRVLSDIASMGAEPRWFLVDLAAPPDTPLAFAQGVQDGMLELAKKYSVALAGGDTARGPVFELHVFGVGEAPRGAAILRSGANPGDAIFATGSLGGSFESGKHLAFEPRVLEGIWLRGRASAMTDISDGLASELWNIATESGASLQIKSALIPLAQAALARPDPLAAAFCDGEDFELLFTAPEAQARDILREWSHRFPDTPCARIGVVAPAGGPVAEVFCDGAIVPRGGFDHFANRAAPPTN